jgi:ABC-type nickel/cobalt efflux system permease component RcnA
VAVRRTALFAACIGLAVFALALAAGFVADAWAQAGPFGVPRPQSTTPPPPAYSGVAGWLLAKQAEFYRGLSGAIRAAKADGSAVWGLFGLSFLYGIFHAAGPGHGKAVISSYLVANEETWRRGIVLSFASALLQAIVAVLVVGIAAWLLSATAKTMCSAERVIEIVSYALIALLGARLLWVKGRGLIGALRGMERKAAPVGAAVTPAAERHDHHHHTHGNHGHDNHGHEHHLGHGSDQHGHGHDHHHDHASAWGHAHAPEPQELAGPGGWRRGLTAIIAVGLRPCSGAILVLVFALAQGLFWAGVVATFVMGLGTAITVAAIATLAVGAKALAARFAARRTGYGTLALRGLEVAAAALVLAFGTLLLIGYMAAERTSCL